MRVRSERFRSGLFRRSSAVMVLALVASLVSVATPAAAAPGDIVIYGANAYGFNDIYEVNLTQSTATYEGDTALSSQAIDQDPATGLVWYYEWRSTGDELGYWDPDTGANVIAHVFSPRPGVYAKRLAFDDEGVMWMMDSSEGLWEIDHTAGSMIFRGAVSGITGGPYGATGDMAFAPDGTLYIATYRELYTVDIDTLSANLLYTDMIDVPVSGVVLWTGLAFCDGMLYASNGEEATSRSGMFEIDPATGSETFLYYLPSFVNDLTSCSAMPEPVNTAPVADDDSVTAGFETAVGVILTATDADGDALTYQVVSGPTNGALTGTAPNLTYTPDAGHSGADTFTFTADDGTATSNTATVTITTDPASNAAPVANDDSLVTAADTAVGVILTATDADGDALTYQVVSGPTNGALTGTAPNLTYTPDAGHSGADTFTFTASDGIETSNTATITVTTDPPPNTAPVANDDSVTTAFETAVGITLTATDADGDALTYQVVSGPTNGTLTGTAPNLTYTPDPGHSGADTFTFTASDGIETSNTATITVTTDPSPNTAPVANDDSVVTGFETAVAVTLTATDADGDALTYQVVSGPTNGTLTGTAPNLTYTPDPGHSGADTFTFTASDGIETSNTATITVTTDPPPNTAPVANDDSVATGFETAVAVTLTATDADGDALTYQVVSGPTNGTLSGVAPNVTYTPDVGHEGADTFTFTASDGIDTSNTATVTVTTSPEPNTVPEAPAATSAAADDTSVTLSWSPPSDDGGTPVTDYVIEFAPIGGTWATFADGVSSATSAVVSGLTNYDRYEFRVAAVNAVGTGPTGDLAEATPTDGDDPDDTFNRPDGPLSGGDAWTPISPEFSDLQLVDGHVVGTGDPDGTGAAYTTPVGPHLEVTIDALLGEDYNEASVVLRLNSTSDITESYLLQWVTDGEFAEAGSIPGPTLQIWRIDAGPTFVLLTEATLPDNGERTLTFGADGSNLYISENGTVLLSTTDSTYATGDFIVLGQANLSGGGTASQLDNFRYQVLDPPNTAPVANDDALVTAADTAVGVTLTATDADGDALSYQVVSGPTNGSLTGTAPNLTYTPDPGHRGADSFTFTASDGTDTSNTATVTITTDPDPNTAPVADDGSVSTEFETAVGVTLTATDGDGDVLSYQVVSGPTNGTLTGTAPNLTYTPDAGHSGADTFTFTASDGIETSNTATITITTDPAPPTPQMYGGNRGGLNLEIDPTGPTTTVAPGLSVGTHAMASDPLTGEIYYFEWSVTGDEFVRFDPDTGTHTSIRTYSPAPGIYFTGLVMAPSGILHAMDASGGFHEIDPATGDITTLGTISGLTSGIYGQLGDLEYDDAGTLYFASYEELYEIDVATLSATTLYSGMIPGGGTHVWTGLSYCDGVLWAVDIRAATVRSTLYTIDVATGTVTTELALTTYLTDLTTCRG